MSKSVKKAAPNHEKKWHPTAEQCAYAILAAEDSTVWKAPRVFDPTLTRENGKAGDHRLLTDGEITKGKRYLDRGNKRAEFAEKKRRREVREGERELARMRAEADAKKLASARQGIARMMSKAV